MSSSQELTSASAILDSSKKGFQPTGKDPMNGEVQVFHVGRPDLEEPHRSMERCERFHQNNPASKLVVFLWTKQDVDEFTAKKHMNTEVVLWESDSQLQAWLMDRIRTIVGTRIVWPQWFLCANSHITAFNYENKDGLIQVRKTDGSMTMGLKCEKCELEAVHVHPHEEKVTQFCELFTQVIRLTNFDTVSGEFLHKYVNPTGNVLKNLLLGHMGCAHAPEPDLKGYGKGKPILLLGAGPSLDKAMPHLKRLQDKCLIACVGRVFKKLLDYGIVPDFTTTVEMFDWDKAIFDGITAEDASNTTLLFGSVAAPATVAAWPGRRACMWDMACADLLKRNDWIYGGNSVTHTQLNYAAQILDCEPLILVGTDLAYTEPRSHCDGAAPATWPEDIKEYDKNYHTAQEWGTCTGKGNDFHPECHATPAPHGALIPSRIIWVRTSMPYKNFCTLFEILIARHKKKVYNACPNGLKIDGTEYLDLETYDPEIEPKNTHLPLITASK